MEKEISFEDFKAEVLYENAKLKAPIGNVKAWEIAIQNAVEKFTPDKCWWQVVPQNIFLELVSGRTVVEEMKDVYTSLDKYLKENMSKNCPIKDFKKYIEKGGETTSKPEGLIDAGDKEK